MPTLCYDHVHGDNGAGLGGSHQTGWTGIVARTMHLFATATAERARLIGKMAAVVETPQSQWDSRPVAAVESSLG